MTNRALVAAAVELVGRREGLELGIDQSARQGERQRDE